MLLPALIALAALPAPGLAEGHTRHEEGRLDESDPKLSGGEYLDRLTFEVREPGPVIVRLSARFDGYLIVQPPDWATTGEGQLENDDWEGDLTESRIEIPAAQVGTWTVGVTAANAGVGGAYRLSVDLPGPDPTAVRRQSEEAQLSALDPQLNGGEYHDRYRVALEAGEQLVVRMDSEAFDTYLALLDGEGNSLLQNDDAGGAGTNSMLEHRATGAGTFTVIATSAPPEVTGPYAIHLETWPASAAGEAGEVRSGRLEAGDEELDSGAWVDVLNFRAPAGSVQRVELFSDEFDTLLMVLDSSGEVLAANDDFQGQAGRSRAVVRVPADGEVVVGATSYGPATGAYSVSFAPAEEGEQPADAGGPRGVSERVETGRLEPGDGALDSGEYVDEVAVELAAGESVELVLESTEFDAFLAVVDGSGEVTQVDDVEGSLNPSLGFTSVEGEALRVLVTSSRPGATGAWTLTVRTSSDAAEPAEFFAFEGELDAGDDRLSGGEYLERHEVELEAGVEYSCLLVSSAFDAYLGIRDPGGETVEDDDSGGDGDAQLVYTAGEAGSYRFTVTSSGPGEAGSYVLLIAPTDPAPAGAAPLAAPAASILTLTEAAAGRLSEGDGVLENGEFNDVWAFDATAGESYAFELESAEFDTYLVLIDGADSVLQNDDFQGQRTKSGIEWTADATGRIALVATSYRAGETGSYTLRARTTRAAAPATGGPGRVYGLFIGISDYPGEDSDLALCDEDAAKFRRELVEHAGMQLEDSVLLINREAGREPVASALGELAAKVGEGDTLVVFYSGHGTRVKRSQLVERDPDGHDSLDEALVLHDGLLLDDELDELLVPAGAGTSLIVLDACFSGGFSKDVISRPGRMGLFSSHEDVTSSTAAKFQAGGYLAAFAAAALGDDQAIADANADGLLSASEFSQYLYESYRNELVRAKSSDFLDVSQNLGFQQLIVDRGGVSVNHALFRLR